MTEARASNSAYVRTRVQSGEEMTPTTVNTISKIGKARLLSYELIFPFWTRRFKGIHSLFRQCTLRRQSLRAVIAACGFYEKNHANRPSRHS